MSQYHLFTPRQHIIYNFIKEHPGVGQREIANFLGVQRPTVQDRLFPMIGGRYIREKVISKRTHKKGYWIDKRKRL